MGIKGGTIFGGLYLEERIFGGLAIGMRNTIFIS